MSQHTGMVNHLIVITDEQALMCLLIAFILFMGVLALTLVLGYMWSNRKWQ